MICHTKKYAYQGIELFSKTTCVLLNIFGSFLSNLHVEHICGLLEVQISISGDFNFLIPAKLRVDNTYGYLVECSSRS